MYICALDRVCQVEKDVELRCQIVGECFFLILLKIMEEKSFAKLLNMVLVV